jgi:Rod binding domain-containing protein
MAAALTAGGRSLAADLTISAVSSAPQKKVETPLADQAFRTHKVPDAAQKFESFVLQTFIQEMMPETAEGVYGSGVAGDFWKSMMSEKIAEQVAERGSVGIADYVRKGHKVPANPGGVSSPSVLGSVATLNGVAVPPLPDASKALGE